MQDYITFLPLLFVRIRTCNGDTENPPSPKKVSAQANVTTAMLTSFIQPDILKHLCRELDRDKVEAEFSIRVRLQA